MKKKENNVEEENEEVKKTENTYTKKQLISSKKFNKYKDVLNVIVKDNEELTIAEVEARIEKFKKGKVI